jgi:4-hydroxy-2-oxoheptanedioate aldolase
MIETAEAVESIDSILSVPGIDGVYVGPVDLSLTLGLPPGTDHDDDRFASAIRRIVDACQRHGIVPGIHADASLAAKWRAAGFRLITVGYDQFAVLSGLRAELDQARAGGPFVAEESTAGY